MTRSFARLVLPVAVMAVCCESPQGPTIPIATLVVGPHAATLAPTDTFRFATAIYGAHGEAPTDSSIRWGSSSPFRVSVTQTGLATALQTGSVWIKAVAGSARDSALVQVEAAVRTIRLAPDSQRIVKQSIGQVSATVYDSIGEPLYDRRLTWTTSDSSIATVDGYGTITVLTPGKATISVAREGVRATAKVVGFTLQVVGLVSGSSHNCGLGADSAAYCWGSTYFDGGSAYAVPVPGAQRYVTMAAGDLHTCALTPAGVAWCWGFNNWGQIGAPITTLVSTPVQVPGGLSYKAITGGEYHTCAITTGGATYCWGANVVGELGDSGTDTSAHPDPVLVRGGLLFTKISAGGDHACGLTSVGAAYCWGNNTHGQLGTGDSVSSAFPVPVTGSMSFAAIGAGADYTCALDAQGAAYCWGNNHERQLGTGDTISTGAPTPVTGGWAFASLSVGSYHACGVTVSGKALCWGRGDEYALGTGTPDAQSAPTAVVGGLSFLLTAAGQHQTCGLTTGKIVYCWGSNSAGQIGDGTTNGGFTPTKVTGQ